MSPAAGEPYRSALCTAASRRAASNAGDESAPTLLRCSTIARSVCARRRENPRAPLARRSKPRSTATSTNSHQACSPGFSPRVIEAKRWRVRSRRSIADDAMSAAAASNDSAVPATACHQSPVGALALLFASGSFAACSLSGLAEGVCCDGEWDGDSDSGCASGVAGTSTKVSARTPAPPGVGSNGTQPTPSMSTSGQACRSPPSTTPSARVDCTA